MKKKWVQFTELSAAGVLLQYNGVSVSESELQGHDFSISSKM